MRKSLVAVVLLLGLGLGGVCGTVAAVGGADEKVAVQETVVLGDRSALDGLELTLVTQSAQHLLWTTECTFTGELTTETEFDFSRNRLNWEREYTPSGIDLYMASYNFGSSTSGGGGMDLEEYMSQEHETLWKPIVDVAARAPAGQTYYETVDLSDYYDHYPLYTRWNGSWWEEGAEPLSALLTDFFRVPVRENELVEVRIDKDDEGNIWEVGIHPAKDGSQEFYTRSAAVEGGTYFTLYSYAEEWVEEDGVINTYRTPVDVYLSDGSMADVGLWYLPEMENETAPLPPSWSTRWGRPMCRAWPSATMRSSCCWSSGRTAWMCCISSTLPP